jgi:menaquinone-9 beta-reductase
MADYDVAVVGASIAGSTVATLLGRAGLRVALIERHRDMEAFKVLCTHHIMACAVPTIRRLGVDRDIEAAGGVRNGLNGYTPWGWITPPPGLPHGYGIRRQKLDPMLRRLAAETPGVDLLLGQRVTRLVEAGGSVGGVVLSGLDGGERMVRSRLVVGADGAHSTVAELAGAEAKTAPNARFVYFAQFTGVRLTAPDRTHLWMHEPGINYAMPNDCRFPASRWSETPHSLPTPPRAWAAAGPFRGTRSRPCSGVPYWPLWRPRLSASAGGCSPSARRSTHGSPASSRSSTS